MNFKLIIALLLIIPSVSALDLTGLLGEYSFDIDMRNDFNNLRNGTTTGSPTHVSSGCVANTGCYRDTFSSSKYMSIAHDAVFNSQGKNFTISIWVNNTDTDGTYVNKFTGGFGASGIPTGWYLRQAGSNLDMTEYQDGSTYTTWQNPGTVSGWTKYTWTVAGSNWTLYKNGVYQNSTTQTGRNYDNSFPIIFGVWGWNGNNPYGVGGLDEFTIWNRSLSAAEVLEEYDCQVAGTDLIECNAEPSLPYAEVFVYDLFDGAPLAGLTVAVGNASNTTSGAGIATIINPNAYNYTVESNSLYFSSSGVAVENSSVNAGVYGARVLINASNIIGSTLSNFSISVINSSWNNYTTSGYAHVLLKPNETNLINISVYDGNYTYNDSRQTYVNFSWPLNTTGLDTGTYEITGLYQSLLIVNVSLGLTNNYITNHTTNVTGNVNYSEFTSNYTTTYRVMWNNYSLVADPAGYSLSYKNITIGAYNYTYYATIPAYALNSFYINLLDEITQQAITETMLIEVITDFGASQYSTNNGSISFEGLTPSDYTIRYRSNSSNYTERDYFQTLINQNYYDLTLYSLSIDDSTPTQVIVTDTNSNPVEGAIVKMLRYYWNCNCYSVVEMSETGAAGNAYFVADAYDGNYKFSVDYAGQNYFLSTSSENLIPKDGLITKYITINLGAPYFRSYRDIIGLGSSLIYNNETKALSFSWSDPSGIVTSGCLYARYVEGIGYNDISPACQNSSTGSVFLVLNNTERTHQYWTVLTTNSTYSEYSPYSGFIDKISSLWFSQDPENPAFGAYIGSLVVISLGLIFSFSAVGVVLVSMAGMAVLAGLQFFSLGATFIVGLITVVLGISLFLMRR